MRGEGGGERREEGGEERGARSEERLSVEELAVAIAERLGARGERLAVAESAAGGLISHLLTNVPGSSAWFLAGVVAYSNASKCQLVGVDPAGIARSGTVSPETALALARGIRARMGSDWGLGETGIAGPQTGRRSTKPAGLAYLAISGAVDGRIVEQVVTFESGLDDRLANKVAFACAGLELLRDALEGLSCL